MKTGRPSSYSKAYCDEVIACGSEGLSLTAFAGHIGVARSTIHEWMQEHQEFSIACKKAMAKRTMFLEKGMLSSGATGPMVTARRFALVNASVGSEPQDWREKQAVELSGPNGEPIKSETTLNTSLLSTTALKEILAARNAALETDGE
jgi:hypothetical protein